MKLARYAEAPGKAIAQFATILAGTLITQANAASVGEEGILIDSRYILEKEHIMNIMRAVKTMAAVAVVVGIAAAQTGTVTDSRDGKKYKTVTVAGTKWMAENLNYQTASGSWCYDNNSANCAKYGRLYDWNTAITACPAGWRLASLQDWGDVNDAVGGKEFEDEEGFINWDGAGKKLRAKSGWTGNGNGTDDVGFSALPGGGRNIEGKFSAVGERGSWWTAWDLKGAAGKIDMSYVMDFMSGSVSYNIVFGGYAPKSNGKSVRCVAVSAGSGSNTSPPQPLGEGGSWADATGAARVAFDRGTAAYKANNYGEAIREFSEAIRLSPGCFTCYSMRSMMYRQVKDWDKSIDDATNIISRDSSSAMGYHLRGFTYVEKGEYTKALADLETSQRLGIDKFGKGLKDTEEKMLAKLREKLSGGGGSTGLAGMLIDSRDGKKYKTVNIGNYTWMAANLNYLPQSGKSWCYRNNNVNCDKYGRLYDWNTAQSVCPTGWRLPSDDEWNDLGQAVGGVRKKDELDINWNGAGTKLKTKSGWNKSWDNKGNGTDDYGFSALPGGEWLLADVGFGNIGNSGGWWSSMESPKYKSSASVWSTSDDLYKHDTDKNFGFSVRCVKNN